MARPYDEWQTCDVCGGEIPPESQWGKRGERASGYCPGHMRNDGMCAAFAPRTRYRDTRAHNGCDA